MVKTRLCSFVAVLACASLLGARAYADDKSDFERSVEFGIRNMKAQVQTEMTGGFSERTFQTVTNPTGHGKGLIKKSLTGVSRQTFRSSKAGIPDKLDLRPSLTQVEDQGMCGSCWAFSLTATHRDGHALGGKDPGRLSQEWLVDNSPEASGCDGGYFDSANDFIKPKGQPLWKDCPYSAGSGKCSAGLTPAAHITAWHMLGDSNGPSVQDIEGYMASAHKPVSITVAAAAGNWEGYGGGVYNACKDGQEDHMINIVGWDNEGATFDSKGNLPPGKGIWIVRNSWGTSWGEGGYMRTKMTDAKGNRCNKVASEAAYFEFGD